jgi:hypothetical protein
MGQRITHLRHYQGFCAETTGGVVLDPSGILIATGCDQDLIWANTNYILVFHKFSYNPSVDGIFGVRLDASGIALDSAFRISSSNQSYVGQPVVAFDGVNCLVAWKKVSQSQPWTRIMASRVTPNGTVLDTQGIYLSADTAGFPSIAFDGMNYLVVWSTLVNNGSNVNIRGTRISTAGQVLDPVGITISGADSVQARPAMAFGSGRYLVAWEDKRLRSTLRSDIFGARVTIGGSVMDPTGIAVRKSIPGCQSSSSVAFDGTNYMAVWRDARSASFPLLDCDIYGIRLDENGNAVDDHAFPIALGPDEIIDPLICYGGSQYLVIYGSWFDNDTEKLAGLMVATDGTISDSFIISEDILSGTGSSYSVAFGDTVFLVVWNQNDFVKASRISQSGLVLDPGGFVVDSYIHGIVNSNVIYGDSNFMVLWHCGWPGSLFAKRIAIDGSIIDTIPIHITNTVLWNDEYSLAFGGGNYLIVWSHYLDIFGCRISQSGVVIDTCIIIISDLPFMERSPAVEYDGTNYGIVWEVSADSFSYDLYGAKVNSQGQVVNRFPVVTARGDQVEPVMARGSGDRMLLTYNGWTPYINSHPAGTDRIWGKLYPFTGLQETPAAVNVGLDFLTTRPNPFRDRIEFQLSPGIAQSAERRELTIYDVSGRLIRSFALCPMLSALCWDGTDQSGRKVSAGIYFVRLTAPHRELIQKIILLK